MAVHRSDSSEILRARFARHGAETAAEIGAGEADPHGSGTSHDRGILTLGPEGKRLLEEAGAQDITLERVLPRQWRHMAGVNDIRIAVESSGAVSYFFSYWELPGSGWKHPVIPDAVFRLRGRTFAVEYDRGAEGVRFFIGSKIAAYLRGVEGFPFSAVLIIADRSARMEALARAIRRRNGLFLFGTLERVKERGILAPLFVRESGGEEVSML